jgi:transcriptional regulator with XRE-family HTH domain
MDNNSQIWFNNSEYNYMNKNKKINQAFLNVLYKLDITSIKELAELSGLDQATVSRQFHRKQPLSDEHMELYSKVLNVPKGKFADDHIPTYIVVGYLDQPSGKVTARGEEEAQKVIFHNEYAKIKGAKIIYDPVGNHVLRYNGSTKSPVNCYCFIKKNKPYLQGIVGFVKVFNEEKKTCKVLTLNGETIKVEDYQNIYPITSTHNITHNTGTVVITEF